MSDGTTGDQEETVKAAWLSAGLSCSFCAKGQDKVKQLIASDPHEITGYISYICNECVSLCVEIIIAPDLRPKKAR